MSVLTSLMYLLLPFDLFCFWGLVCVEVMLFNGLDLEHIIGLKTKTLEDTYRLDRLVVYNSVLSALSRKQVLQLETFTEVHACGV